MSEYLEESNERLGAIHWDNGYSIKESRAEHRSISPMGDHVWVKNRLNSFYVNVKNKTSGKSDSNWTSGFPYIVGLHADYISISQNAMVMEVRELATKKAWSWRPLGHTRTLENLSLYNAFANDGKWFRESG
ncbi:hypothetical protein [Vibrio coralliilyticus]|uniref:hypothetical protein n=1 Tax=Vibrio coralliilyticus TaxID=190893 RepID=UPI001D0D7E3B|nr:hypothetical protein [Vibrio coralliilyticus]